MSATDSQPRGRPRSQTADRAILEATLELLGRDGYTRMSVEAVAAVAAVSKATIYRRYTGKADLVSAAVAKLTDPGEVPDTGSTRRDLEELGQIMMNTIAARRGVTMIGTLLVEEQHNPELLELFRQRVILPRRARIAQIIERGKQRGEVRPQADLEGVIDCLSGSYLARHLSGGAFTPEWIKALIDTVWRGLSK